MLEVESNASDIQDGGRGRAHPFLRLAVLRWRPHSEDLFHQRGSIEAFDRAIEDTITALNTGCLRARDGTVLHQAKGKAYLTNPTWREKLDALVDILRAIRSRYDLALNGGTLRVGRDDGDRKWYCINDHNLAAWMDGTRAQAIQIIADVCKEAGVLHHMGHATVQCTGKAQSYPRK